MAHITPGGASDSNVDRDYIAPPGVAPEQGLADGIPTAGEDNGPSDLEKRQAEDRAADAKEAARKERDERDAQRAEQPEFDGAGTSTRNSGDDSSGGAGTGRAKPNKGAATSQPAASQTAGVQNGNKR